MKKLIVAIAIFGLLTSLANAQDNPTQWVEIGVADGAITISNTRGEDVPMLGLNVSSTGDWLTANGSGPFQITVQNTPKNVVVGNLGNPYVLATDATVATEIGYAGPIDDLATSLAGTAWGNGTVPTPVSFPVVPEPTSGLLACLAALGLLGFRRHR